MSLPTAVTAQIMKTYQRTKNDSGSSEVQIALLSARIEKLTEHLKIHKHDFHTRYGLTLLVSKRRRLMRYFKRKNFSQYQTLIQSLNLRG